MERREAQPVPLNRRVLSQSTLGGPDRKGLAIWGPRKPPGASRGSIKNKPGSRRPRAV